jgi:polysaccharide pyruvyl transferase WcaK-like protein
LALSMRLHSCIFAYGAKTKFIPLGGQDKVQHFVQDTGVPDYTIWMKDRAQDTAESIYGKIVTCLKDKAFDEALETSFPKQLKLLQGFNDKLIQLFK